MTPKSDRSQEYSKVLRKGTINQAVVKAEYAVRGEIALRSEKLREELAEDDSAKDRLGFDKVISANIGNPQQLGQKGLTFLRQVASLTEYPELLDHPLASQIYPADALKRARWLLEEIGSIGAYSHSKGVPAIRKLVAKFIEERDGYPADPELIYLTGGASAGVSNIMQVLISGPDCGVLIPIPQYPLYTAALALLSAHACPYYLDEADQWSASISSIKESLKKSRSEGVDVRAIVVINPGNPTGSCLPKEDIIELIKFAHEERLVLLADEVYQTNVFDPKDRPFHSFKKILKSMGAPYADSVELVSFHSTSKGQIGECGRRGGYFELVNIDPEVEDQIYKLASAQLCSTISGQIGVSTMVAPPQEGDESYKLYKEEVDGIQAGLRHRSENMLKAFNKLEGVECTDAQGALYLFPQIHLPEKAKEAAKKAGKPADAFYCFQMLEKTGICVVPGSGFGQKEGTLHFRTTFLPPDIDAYCDRIGKFHKDFMSEHAD